ncbi:MAG: NUDIX hydrolase, partial [Candidatus Hydrogenedentota bacterium]
MTDSPPVRPASTVLLCRDTEDGLEVFMVRRHHQIDFASGALVFPGGKVEDSDSHPDLAAFCDGADWDDPLTTFRVAALREAFEESGVLLARDSATGNPIASARHASLYPHRDAVAKGEQQFSALLSSESLRLDLGALGHFAHWITPEGMPKRFDTHFFIARAPGEQLAAHDGEESVDSVWIRPQDALDAGDSGRFTVIFPTRCNLALLAEANDVEDAIARTNGRAVQTVLPTFEQQEDGMYLRMPE